MGVRGLESFIKENRTSLCRTITFSASASALAPEDDIAKAAESGSGKARTPVVVDAWGIVFKLYLDTLPWTSGGEYLRFYKAVKGLVKAWRRVGLEPIFVFDGAAPAEKHDTLVKRGQEKIVACQLFYTTSIASRSAPSFSRQSGSVVLPFFASHAFVLALHRMGADTHFVPQGEADGVCVVMAEKVGGYVLGRDSDFAVLVGKTERCKGYAPLDMMSWIEGQTDDTTTSAYRPPGVRNGPQGQSFQPVYKGRRNPSYQSNHRQSSLLPSPAYHNPTLVLTVIAPQALRQRLRIPANYLPLFASLCGTDYTPPSITQQFFEPTLSPVQRIEKAARILREQLYSPSPQQSARGRSGTSTPNPADQVVQLVQKVIKKLCIYPYDTEQGLNDTVDIVIEAALQYQLPPDGSCCSLYPFCGELEPMGCQTPVNMGEHTLPVASASGKRNHQKMAKEAYAEARRRGLLSTITHGWLFPDRLYMWHVLEDPSGPNWKTTEKARELRRAAWIIADQGLGGLRWPQGDVQNPTQTANGHEDQPETDNLKEDRELRELLGLGDSGTESEATGDSSEGTTLVDVSLGQRTASSSSPSTTVPVRTIIEWCRPGSMSKIAACPLILPPAKLSDPNHIPTCLLPLDERLRLYLQPLQSDIPAILALPISLQPLVSLIRFCLTESANRPSARTDVHKWRMAETVAVLRACLGTYSMWCRETNSEAAFAKGSAMAHDAQAEDNGGRNWPLLESRNSGIVAQIGSAWADAHVLAQALLLMPDIACPPSTSARSSRSHSGVRSDSDMDMTDGVEGKARPGTLEAEDWDLGPTHMIPYVFFSGINLHLLLSKSEPSHGTSWRWGEKEQKMFDACWAALIEGLGDGIIVGLKRDLLDNRADTPGQEQANGTGPSMDEGVEQEYNGGGTSGVEKHEVEGESEGDKKKNKKKKKRRSNERPAGQGQQVKVNGGRFDLLDGLTM